MPGTLQVKVGAFKWPSKSAGDWQPAGTRKIDNSPLTINREDSHAHKTASAQATSLQERDQQAGRFDSVGTSSTSNSPEQI